MFFFCSATYFTFGYGCSICESFNYYFGPGSVKGKPEIKNFLRHCYVPYFYHQMRLRATSMKRFKNIISHGNIPVHMHNGKRVSLHSSVVQLITFTGRNFCRQKLVPQCLCIVPIRYLCLQYSCTRYGYKKRHKPAAQENWPTWEYSLCLVPLWHLCRWGGGAKKNPGGKFGSFLRKRKNVRRNLKVLGFFWQVFIAYFVTISKKKTNFPPKEKNYNFPSCTFSCQKNANISCQKIPKLQNSVSHFFFGKKI